MKHKLFIILVFTAYLSVPKSASAQDSTSQSLSPVSSWASRIGGDLFLTGEGYTLHFGRVGFFSLTGGGGLGLEVRVRPVFIGIIGSMSSGEVHPNNLSQTFFNATLYAGVIVEKYRLEIGEIHGSTYWADQTSPPEISYATYFLGLSRRYGSGFFAEPEVKIMFPSFGGYYQKVPPDYYYYRVVPEHYGIGDLFFAFSVKLGIGFN